MATRQREMKKAELGAGIARRLRAKRLELAVSTDTLAAAAGVGRAQVVRTEAGQGGGCRLDTLTLLADPLKRLFVFDEASAGRFASDEGSDG